MYLFFLIIIYNFVEKTKWIRNSLIRYRFLNIHMPISFEQLSKLYGALYGKTNDAKKAWHDKFNSQDFKVS